VVAVFAPLRVKPGFALRAYQHISGRNGYCLIYALPAQAPFPEPDPETEDDPIPPDALPEIMQAITGDGTARSYLLASLLARELGEVGIVGYGSGWKASYVQGSFPWRDGDGVVSPGNAHPTSDPDTWEWMETAPDTWSPQVIQVGVVQVRMTVYSALERETIQEIVDTYPPSSYAFTTETRMIAYGGEGYVW
jgi:hypothetical protein